jgi:hypothetical protein
VSSRSLVSLERRVEPGRALGYVVDLGPRWFVLSLVDDGIRFNGFQIFRFSDVSRVESPHVHAQFVESALRLRGERRPRKRALDLTSIARLLKSAARHFPLVTLHREIADPDVCHIGRVISATARNVSSREITPDAEWDEELTSYPCSEITRVDLGGNYEKALLLVAVANMAFEWPWPSSLAAEFR